MAGFCSTVYAAWREHDTATASAATTAAIRRPAVPEAVSLRQELTATRTQLVAANQQLQRWNHIYGYSSRYHIGADLASQVYDAALAEGIEPELGFRIVNVESEFKPRATSPVGAVGLLQVMPETARNFERGITRERLYDERTNLRIGFRYLRGLIREYNGSVRLALLVYNRGPVAVETLRGMGMDPSNGYEQAVMKGYRGRGVVE